MTLLAMLSVTITACGLLGQQKTWQPSRPNASWIEQLGAYVFQSQVESCALANNTVYRSMIDGVMIRLLTALRRIELGESTRDLPWTVQVVIDDDVNASAFPGGGVLVNTGLLDQYARHDQTFLAVVLAHEIVHVTRGHTETRLMQDKAVLDAATEGVDINKLSPALILRVLLLMGLGELQQVAPFVKAQELEADRLGLYLLALADYDPSLAPSFWEKLRNEGRLSSGFSLTHPATEERIVQLQALLPEVAAYRKACVRANAERRQHDSPVDCGAIK